MPVPEWPSEPARIWAQNWRDIMQSHEISESIAKPSGGLLGGWISRTDLALQL
ncbi:MAG: hypothetical protein RI979_887, partial [Pseudomonadota bacterium]